ncbi:MAG TPA: hypothetical protein VK850_06995 [Candidatus Binatia bacterium]|nr:hypothetical protein [Candidatus Binatia bacterium]
MSAVKLPKHRRYSGNRQFVPELKHTVFQKLAFWVGQALINCVLRALSLAILWGFAANAGEIGQPVPEWELQVGSTARP